MKAHPQFYRILGIAKSGSDIMPLLMRLSQNDHHQSKFNIAHKVALLLAVGTPEQSVHQVLREELASANAEITLLPAQLDLPAQLEYLATIEFLRNEIRRTSIALLDDVVKDDF